MAAGIRQLRYGRANYKYLDSKRRGGESVALNSNGFLTKSPTDACQETAIPNSLLSFNLEGLQSSEITLNSFARGIFGAFDTKWIIKLSYGPANRYCCLKGMNFNSLFTQNSHEISSSQNPLFVKGHTCCTAQRGFHATQHQNIRSPFLSQRVQLSPIRT